MNIDLDPKYSKFIRTKERNPRCEWEHIDSSQCSWVYSDAVRIKKQLIDNRRLITNRRVLDLGCHDGILTQAMVQLGARHVIGTNVRLHMIDLVNSALKDAGSDSVAHVIYHDLYDLPALDRLLANADTVHITGTIFHVSHHYDLLWHLCSGRADHIILDSIYYLPDWHRPQPMQTWHVEDSDNVLWGLDARTRKHRQAFVGIPNLAWYRQALDLFGWHVVNIDYVNFVHFEEKLRRRCILTCQRQGC